MFKIIVDSREPKQIFTKLNKLKETHDFDYSVEILDVGDYYYKDGSVCMERKEISDFYSSIIDGRIFEQVMNMKNNFDNVIIGISGDLKSTYYKIHNFNINKYRGAIASLIVKYKCTIFNTNGDTELLDILLRMCEKSTEPFTGVINKINYKDEDIHRNMLCAIPSIGYKKAKDILSIYSFQTLRNMSIDDLKKIDGIGDKIATQIKKYI